MGSNCNEVSDLLKALSHPVRLMILGHLAQGGKSVNELVEQCQVSQSQVSQYLGRMKAEGLIVDKKDGQFRFYRIKDQRLVELLIKVQSLYCSK